MILRLYFGVNAMLYLHIHLVCDSPCALFAKMTAFLWQIRLEHLYLTLMIGGHSFSKAKPSTRTHIAGGSMPYTLRVQGMLTGPNAKGRLNARHPPIIGLFVPLACILQCLNKF